MWRLLSIHNKFRAFEKGTATTSVVTLSPATMIISLSNLSWFSWSANDQQLGSASVWWLLSRTTLSPFASSASMSLTRSLPSRTESFGSSLRAQNRKKDHPDAIDATQEDTGHTHGLHERRVHGQMVVRRVVLLRPRLVERREDEGLVELVFYES